MGLVVDIGLERFFVADEVDDWTASVRAIVETGATDLVRDALLVDRSVPADTRVYEARRENGAVAGRFLEKDEARPILDAIRATFAEHDSYASFSWDELEAIGAYNVQPLAVVFDADEPMVQVTVAGSSSRMLPIERSRSNFEAGGAQGAVAAALHDLAAAHRLIVHCA